MYAVVVSPVEFPPAGAGGAVVCPPELIADVPRLQSPRYRAVGNAIVFDRPALQVGVQARPENITAGNDEIVSGRESLRAFVRDLRKLVREAVHKTDHHIAPIEIDVGKDWLRVRYEVLIPAAVFNINVRANVVNVVYPGQPLRTEVEDEVGFPLIVEGKLKHRGGFEGVRRWVEPKYVSHKIIAVLGNTGVANGAHVNFLEARTPPDGPGPHYPVSSAVRRLGDCDLHHLPALSHAVHER